MIVAMYASEFVNRQLRLWNLSLKPLAGLALQVENLVGFCLEMRLHANLKPANSSPRFVASRSIAEVA